MKKYLMALAMIFIGSTAFADDYIVIVMDTSGSMGEYMREARDTRMNVAKTALKNVIGKVPTSTKVGILTFDGWSYNENFRTVEKDKLFAAVDQMSPGGGTPLYEYMRAAGTKLLKIREAAGNSGTYRMLVVTDGEATDSGLNQDTEFRDGSLRPGVLKDIVGRGIMVDAIGLDMRGDHSLANQINGSYMSGDDPASLEKAVARSVHAEVNFNDGVGKEMFDEVSQLPDEFAVKVVKALTTYQNHPIGEKPPIMVVREDGTIAFEPDPNNEAVPNLGEEGDGVSTALIVVLVILVVVGIIGLIVMVSSAKRY